MSSKNLLAPIVIAIVLVGGAGLIGFAGFSGYPASTTIVAAWVLTLPATIAISCALFYLLK